MQKTIKFKISGMHCASCAMNIDGELEDMGAESKTIYARSETEVRFDESKISIESIIGAIRKLGYEAVVEQS